jgi:hypothetical protein
MAGSSNVGSNVVAGLLRVFRSGVGANKIMCAKAKRDRVSEADSNV